MNYIYCFVIKTFLFIKVKEIIFKEIIMLEIIFPILCTCLHYDLPCFILS